jgi:hypothetical protein
MTHEELEALRQLRAAVHHLVEEKRDLEQRLAFLALELGAAECTAESAGAVARDR